MKLQRVSIYILGWLVFLGLFELLAVLVNDPLLMPSPRSVLMRAAQMLSEPIFYSDLMTTMGETFAAIMLAIAFGVPLGLALGRFRALRLSAESPLDWLRSIPATALFPAFLLIFGLGRPTRISIAVYSAFFAVMLPAMYGSSQADPDRIRHLRRLGFGHMSVFTHAIIWEALPGILTGMRLAVSSALVLIVVGEMFIGANEGLGFRIIFSSARYDTTSMYATIFHVGLIGYFMNSLVLLFERRVRWQRSAK